MKRVRINLEDGAHLDAHVAENASPAVIDALRDVGQAAVARMQKETSGWLCWGCGHQRTVQDFPNPCPECGARAMTNSNELRERVQLQ